MFFRLARRGPAMATRRILGAFRLHPLSKTSTLHERKRAEDRLLWQRYGRYETPEPRRRALFRKHARRFALRKTAFLALDALGDPRMAWREIRRRAAVALRGDYRAEMDRDSPSPPRRLE
ncbi:MAG: hypothetical protein BWZ10_03330 [candidate division BRC1 bacterium ADurb.BinA364]|nr:MAG: hypothetical protein BWZ10_03330 [candidate division BRC1 bacterium ADurb.BinA364]